jgi:hypothetical protein
LICPQSIFDSVQHRELNGDWPVLCHELGHAVTWFRFGEGIGRLKCCRPDICLKSAVALWPRTDGLEKLWSSPEYAKPYAERLLAGEIAARRALGNIRTDQICSKGLPVNSGIDCLAKTIAHTNPTSDLAKEDVYKVLTLAINNAQSDWCAWVGARLSCAGAVVNRHWAAFEQIARKLEPKLPEVGQSCVWEGIELMAEMERCGINSGKFPAVAIVYSQDEGLIGRSKEVCAGDGSMKIICRYVKNPAEQNQC